MSNSLFYTIARVYNGLGYALFSPNVRGSTGCYDRLMRGNMYDIGGGDLEDLMTGADAVIARGLTSADSIALRGWSSVPGATRSIFGIAMNSRPTAHAPRSGAEGPREVPASGIRHDAEPFAFPVARVHGAAGASTLQVAFS